MVGYMVNISVVVLNILLIIVLIATDDKGAEMGFFA